MRKVDAVKERIDKMIEERDSERKRKDESLSEGEERDDDDYDGPPGVSPGSGDFIDRKKYEGKWADKDKRPEGSNLSSVSPQRGDSKDRKDSKW